MSAPSVAFLGWCACQQNSPGDPSRGYRPVSFQFWTALASEDRVALSFPSLKKPGLSANLRSSGLNLRSIGLCEGLALERSVTRSDRLEKEKSKQ
jgi:hypothetical protein